ncbi:MAG: AtpZ/AtpI family protein [Candidatus Puniceispirillaceae bacterium]
MSGDDDTKSKSDNKPSLAERISDLENRKSKLQEQTAKAHMPAEGMALAGRVATELVAGIVVGGALGWALDEVFDTSPLWLVVLFFLGAVGGIMNVWRIATGRGMAAGYFDEHDEDKTSADKSSKQ